MINIIGAGPTGAYAAYLLAKKGFDTNIYEEHPKIGKPVQCSGILTNTINEIIPIKKELIQNKIRYAKIISPNKDHAIIKFKNPDLIIHRDKFDQYLMQKAIKQGAHLHINHRFIEKKENLLIFKKENEIIRKNTTNKDTLIGADGPASKIRQYITPQKTDNLIGIQAIVKIEKPTDTFEAYFSNEYAPGFFAWIVPENKDYCKIGVATKKNTHHHFQKFLSKNKIKKEQIKNYEGGLIPIHNPKLRIQNKNMCLIGDAATQVKATTGGGIIPGLKAAEALSKSIINKTSYEKELRQVNKELKSHLLIRQILNRFQDSDYDRLIQNLNQTRTKKIIQNLSRDNISSQIMQLIATNPRLLLHAKILFNKKTN